MNIGTIEITPEKVKKQTNLTLLFDIFNINKKFENYKLARYWAERNFNNGEILVESLEVEYIYFQQNVFIEESKDLLAKLKRIGFESLVGFPDEKLFENIASIQYNKKHNVSLSLYKPENGDAIRTAYKIAEDSNTEGMTELSVFLAAVNVLINKK